MEKYYCKPSDTTTLVLSNSWMPIDIIRAERAISKLIGSEDLSRKDDPVKVLNVWGVPCTWSEWISTDEHLNTHQPFMRSKNAEFPIPTILVTGANWNWRKQKHDTSYLYRRFKGICQICHKKYPLKDMSIEHVKPRSLGGADCPTNTTMTCRGCNSKKGSQFPYYDAFGNELKPAKPLPYFHSFVQDKPEWEPYLFKA